MASRYLIDWKTTTSRYSEEPEGLLSLDPQLICYSWISGIPDVAFVVFVRKQPPEIQYLKTTISEEQRREFGRLVEATIGQLESGQFPRTAGSASRRTAVSAVLIWASASMTSNSIEANLIRRPEQATLIGLTNLWTNGLRWHRTRSPAGPVCAGQDRRDPGLGEGATRTGPAVCGFGPYLCEVRAGQYWRMENLKSFDEFLGEALSRIAAKGLLPDGDPRESDASSEAAVAGNRLAQGGRTGQGGPEGGGAVRLCTLGAQSQELPKEEFKREVERHLTGKETEPWEIDLLQALQEPAAGDRAGP